MFDFGRSQNLSDAMVVNSILERTNCAKFRAWDGQDKAGINKAMLPVAMGQVCAWPSVGSNSCFL